MPPIVPLALFQERLALLERWLWDHGPALAGLRRRPVPARLAQDVIELSDLYTTHRAGGLDAAGQRRHLPAKLFYFLGSDAPKAALVLGELWQHRGAGAAWPAKRPWRVLDLGCGVGATAAGVLLALDAAPAPAPGMVRCVEITGVDADAAALRPWRVVTEQAGRIAGIAVETRALTADLTGPLPEADDWHWDLCVAQAVLNELALDTSAGPRPAADWIGRWARRGLTIIIEPALHDTTRPLHQARNLLLAQGGVRVLAPCPHQRDCPMLRRERDWCHEVRLIAPTPMVGAVQALTRRRDERTKWSFVALGPREPHDPAASGATDADHGESATHPPTGAGCVEGRLVSDALNSKGKCERWLCAADGQLVQWRLLDRERTADNELLAAAERGTLVRIENADQLPRVGAQARVRLR